MPFSYKTVLVVGATSGIGLALAEKIIANGSHVIALGRRQENLDALVKNHGSDKVSTVQFDITDLADIPALIKKITTSYPTLDAVILNSGIQRSIDFTHPSSVNLDSISTEFTTNYFSHIHLTVALLPFFALTTTPKALIYTTSSLALIPLPRCPNYSASKAAMYSFLLTLRVQLSSSSSSSSNYSHIKIIELLPPAVQTELHDPKHQPELKGRPIGMPLDEFTERAWRGLEQGEEQIFVGMGEESWKRWEGERQREFREFVGRMGYKKP